MDTSSHHCSLLLGAWGLAFSNSKFQVRTSYNPPFCTVTVVHFWWAWAPPITSTFPRQVYLCIENITFECTSPDILELLRTIITLKPFCLWCFKRWRLGLIDLIDVMCSNIQLFMTAIKYIPQVSFFFPKSNFWNKEDNEGSRLWTQLETVPYDFQCSSKSHSWMVW